MPKHTGEQATLFNNGPKELVRQVARFTVYLWDRFVEDNCQSTAASLSYQTLFAVVPLLTVTYAILDTFKAFGDLTEKVETFLFSNIIPENVMMVQEYLLSFSQQARNLSGPSIALLGVTAFLMLFTIEKTFNEIWRVREPRQGFQRFLMYWAVLTLSAPFMGISLGITGYIESLPLISDVSRSTTALHVVPILLSTGLFTLIYTVVPNCFVPLKNAVIGSFIVALSFELAKAMFAAIMSKSSFEAIYGTFAAVPLFLLWIYVSWTIVLLGAELVKSLGSFRLVSHRHAEAPLFQFLSILELFHLAHKKGEVITDKEIRNYPDRIDLGLWSEIRSLMMELNLIRQVEKSGLVLSKNLGELSIWELYSRLPWQLPRDVGGDSPWEAKLSHLFSALYERNRAELSQDLESLFEGK